MIADGSLDVDVTYHDNDVTGDENLWFLSVGSLADVLGKTVRELYRDENGIGYSYLGIYQCYGEKKFVQRAVNFLEKILWSLPENADNTASVSQLREQAILAATPGNKRGRFRSDFQRSAIIRQYVLKRAEGLCEACNKPAPFSRLNGTPYLEPHHINFLSDGGIDHPMNIGAICPTCHREIHHGECGKLRNKKLLAHVRQKESKLESDSRP